MDDLYPWDENTLTGQFSNTDYLPQGLENNAVSSVDLFLEQQMIISSIC